MKIFKTKIALLKQLSIYCCISIGSTILTLTPSNAVPKTTFVCILQDETYVTVARRGNIQTAPMITWKDTSFGGNYTPAYRCKMVSKRLAEAVSNSGTLANLNMNHGIVNSVPVICYITRKGDKCNAKNILFSLKPSERAQAPKILAELLGFSQKGSGVPLEESAASVTAETTGSVADWIEQEFKKPSDPSQQKANPQPK
jgi:Circadian oscillating protein COP23